MKQNGEGHLQREADECVREGQEHHARTRRRDPNTTKQTNTMSTSDSVSENGGREDVQGTECVIRQCMKLLE